MTQEDEWQTVQKATRRRRQQRRRNRNGMRDEASNSGHGHGHSHAHAHPHNASKFFEKAVAAQLRVMVDAGESVSQEQIEATLETCLQELRFSNYWTNLQQHLTTTQTIGSIVCYGIGNFGTKRPSAPAWQLALAILLREHCQEQIADSSGVVVEMHYFEPLMTEEEAKVLLNRNIHVIKENERGKRSINENNGMTLFFMPHCPLALYTNLFYTNWEFLRNVLVFGNLLCNYLEHPSMDPQKKQALGILETLEPYWKSVKLPMDKKDVAQCSAYLEQAFNDSGLTSFGENSTTEWPQKPQLELPTEYDGEGEVL